MVVETETGINGVSIYLTGKDIKEMRTVKKCMKKILKLARNMVVEKEMIKMEEFLIHKMVNSSIYTTGNLQ